MGRRSRDKGYRGECEVRRILTAAGVGHDWHSADQQRFEGAQCDIVIPGRYAFEVKWHAKPPFGSGWWPQAVKSAKARGIAPAVVYRFDRSKWRIRYELDSGLVVDADFKEWLEVTELPAPTPQTTDWEKWSNG